MIKIKHFSKQLLKVAACFLLVFNSLMVIANAEELSGSCGANVNWNLKNGLLTISGSGDMYDYTDYAWAPWYENRENIIRVVVENGVTRIGEIAFYDCFNLESVEIANSVKTIGRWAFLECGKLKNVKLGTGVESLGQGSFKLCKSLQSISLPSNLKSIGHETFFECSSLRSISVPKSVNEMGESVFSYCSSLLQVIINADIDEVPVWTFYGCTSLINVTLANSIEKVGYDAFHDCNSLKNINGNVTEEVKEEVSNQVDKEIGSNEISDTTVILPGTDIIEDVVVENQDVVINGTVTDDKVTIDANISNNGGWQPVIDKVDEYVNIQDYLEQEEPADVNVTINSGDKVNGDLLENLAGDNVNLVIKDDKVEYKINCNDLVIGKKYKDFKLDYTLEKVENYTKEIKEAVGEADAYYLKFKSNIDFNVTVRLLLGPEYRYEIAAFYQKDDGWDLLQSVTIDHDGYASFYLSSFDIFTKYLIGISVEGVEDGIIPEEMYDDYEGLQDSYGNKYVITGAESKWGMSIGQVTLIMFGVMGGFATIIGSTMFIIYKRKQAKEKIRREVLGK